MVIRKKGKFKNRRTGLEAAYKIQVIGDPILERVSLERAYFNVTNSRASSVYEISIEITDLQAMLDAVKEFREVSRD